MKYQSALVLSTLAAGHAAAGNVRHANFHARRSEAKRGDVNIEGVNWATVAYDLSNVNWSTVKFGNPTPTPTPSQAAPVYTSPPEAVTSAPAQVPDPTSEAAPAKTSEASSPDAVIGDIFEGIESFVASLGAKAGINSKAKSAQGIWLGNDGKYKATFTNDGDKDAVIFCWTAAGMWINANQPLISIKLKGGEKSTVSIQEGFSGGCGAAHSDSELVDGLLNESILEFTAKPNELGCFDVSREINMKGIVMSVKGSQCTSGVSGDQLSCVFVCSNGEQKCGKGGDYDIALGAATQGPCMVGKDQLGQPSGGCQMGDGEHMEVTIYGNRDWPA